MVVSVKQEKINVSCPFKKNKKTTTLNDPDTNVCLFEVLTCDQHAISLT